MGSTRPCLHQAFPPRLVPLISRLEWQDNQAEHWSKPGMLVHTHTHTNTVHTFLYTKDTIIHSHSQAQLVHHFSASLTLSLSTSFTHTNTHAHTHTRPGLVPGVLSWPVIVIRSWLYDLDRDNRSTTEGCYCVLSLSYAHTLELKSSLILPQKTQGHGDCACVLVWSVLCACVCVYTDICMIIIQCDDVFFGPTYTFFGRLCFAQQIFLFILAHTHTHTKKNPHSCYLTSFLRRCLCVYIFVHTCVAFPQVFACCPPDI